MSPKFIKDPLEIDDIKGTRSKPIFKGKTRDLFSHEDIDGSYPHVPRIKAKPYNLMDYSDVNYAHPRKVSKSVERDPLNPIYMLSPQNNRYGDILGSTSKVSLKNIETQLNN